MIVLNIINCGNNMTDVIIDRTKKTVHIISEHLNRTYNLIDDNIKNNDVKDSIKYYIIDVVINDKIGKIILPSEQTNITIII